MTRTFATRCVVHYGYDYRNTRRKRVPAFFLSNVPSWPSSFMFPPWKARRGRDVGGNCTVPVARALFMFLKFHGTSFTCSWCEELRATATTTGRRGRRLSPWRVRSFITSRVDETARLRHSDLYKVLINGAERLALRALVVHDPRSKHPLGSVPCMKTDEKRVISRIRIAWATG